MKTPINTKQALNLRNLMISEGADYVSLEISWVSYRPSESYSLTVFADKDNIQHVMSAFVKATQIKLTKELSMTYQIANGKEDNLRVRFFPQENVFPSCRLVKTTKTVKIPAQPAREETKTEYEVVCNH